MHAYCLFRTIEWLCAICTGLASVYIYIIHLSLLLLTLKYCGCSILQLGHGSFLPNLFKHSLQSSFPQSACCHGSSATSRHMTQSRSASGSDTNLYLESVTLEAILSIFMSIICVFSYVVFIMTVVVIILL